MRFFVLLRGGPIARPASGNTVSFAPMLCILFIGARMRALQLDPVRGLEARAQGSWGGTWSSGQPLSSIWEDTFHCIILLWCCLMLERAIGCE